METVSASYFDALRVRPVAGRTLLPEEDSVPGAAPVVIVSEALWQESPGAGGGVGRTLLVSGVPLTVVGVLPRGFRGLSGDADLWVAHAMAPVVGYTGHLTTTQQFLNVIGRLAEGRSLEQAQAEVSTTGVAAAEAARAAAGAADGAVWSARLQRLDGLRRDSGSVAAGGVLAGAAGFVLLIAMANLSALLLARAVGRARETAVRAALGGARSQMIRLGMLEGAMIGIGGAAAGLLLAAWALAALGSLAPVRLGLGGAHHGFGPGSAAAPGLDWRVALFAVLLSVGAATLAAVIPLLRLSRRDVSGALKAGARGTTASLGTLHRPTLLSVTVTAQVACAVVLLIGAGLLLLGLERLRASDPGFDGAGVLSMRVSAPDRDYGGAAAMLLLEQVLQRVQAVPGVDAATISFCTPYSRCSTTPLYLDDGTGAPAAPGPIVGRHYVAPDHFRTFGIPVVRGRALTAADRAGSPRVAVINETAARRFWPGEDPIGRRVYFGSGGGFASPDSLTEIVGIVGDVLYGAPGEAIGPDFYTSYLQFTWPAGYVSIRAAGGPLALLPALRRAVLDVDPLLPLYDIRTMRERSAAALERERFATRTLAAFALLGVALASLGVYGVMAYSVGSRRREIGIRVALGATRRGIIRLVLSQAATLAVAGLAIGAAAALALTRVLTALMPGIGGAHPAVFAAALGVLFTAALVAALLPARRAARVDPLEALAAD
jgi:putative ABC transport system permease protein